MNLKEAITTLVSSGYQLTDVQTVNLFANKFTCSYAMLTVNYMSNSWKITYLKN